MYCKSHMYNRVEVSSIYNQDGFSDIIEGTSGLFFKMLFRGAQETCRLCIGVAVGKATFVVEQRRFMTPGVALPSEVMLSRWDLFVELKSLLLLQDKS